MPVMPPTHRPPGARTNQDRYRADVARRGTRHEQGYTNAWGRARRQYLNAHPLCVMCARRGKIVAANVVDHRIPHKGDQQLFWDMSNWQSLCALCHNGPKRRIEAAMQRASSTHAAAGPARRSTLG